MCSTFLGIIRSRSTRWIPLAPVIFALHFAACCNPIHKCSSPERYAVLLLVQGLPGVWGLCSGLRLFPYRSWLFNLLKQCTLVSHIGYFYPSTSSNNNLQTGPTFSFSSLKVIIRYKAVINQSTSRWPRGALMFVKPCQSGFVFVKTPWKVACFIFIWTFKAMNLRTFGLKLAFFFF